MGRRGGGKDMSQGAGSADSESDDRGSSPGREGSPGPFGASDEKDQVRPPAGLGRGT